MIDILPIPVAHVEYSCDSGDGNREDNPENSTDQSSCEHHDENKNRGEVEWFTHDFWYEEVILDLLDRYVEEGDNQGDFPWDSQTDDKCWYEGDDGSDIGNKLHNPSDNSKRKGSLRIETKYHLKGEKPDICDCKYGKWENEHSSHPCRCHMLDLVIMIMEVCIDFSGSEW